MKRSLRWRLAWTFMLLTTFAVLIQAVALFISTEEREEDLIDEVVNTALDEQARNTAGGASDDAHHLSSRMRLFRLAGNQVPPGMPSRLASVKPGNYEWVTGNIEYHVGIRQRDGERLYLLYDASEHEERLDQMFWNLLIGLVFLSLLSLWVGYWLSERMLYQFGKIIRRLEQDDEGKLNEAGFDREVALLAGALDDYRQRNRELLAREREFTSNVSHELRTPLTRIRTGAELFTEDATLSERARERAERIIKAADDMESRLRGLLFLARELAPAERQQVDLRQCAESCAAHFRAQCDAAGVRLDIDIPPGTLVDADRSLLQLLLENLIGNAARHTAEGSIEIGYRDGVLAVADTGSGIPPEHLANVFQRYYRASNLPGGLGLGLSIVKRVCDAHGWKCTVESGEGRKGTKVSVALNGG